MEEFLNQHIKVYQDNQSSVLYVNNLHGRHLLLNKHKKQVNKIDHIVTPLIRGFACKVPIHYYIKFRINESGTSIDYIRHNKRFIKDTTAINTISKSIGCNINKKLFEGTLTELKLIEKYMQFDNLVIESKNKIARLNYTFKKTSEEYQLLITDIIEYLYENNINYPIQGTNFDDRYLDLIKQITTDIYDHVNLMFDLGKVQYHDFDYSILDKYKPLFYLLVNIFYEPKKTWSGFFYSKDFETKFQNLYSRILFKINNTNTLTSLSNEITEY